MTGSAKERRNVYVRDLQKMCGYPPRPGGPAVSQRCTDVATTFVTDNGQRLFRCNRHKDRIDAERKGESRNTIYTSDPIPGDVIARSIA